MSDEVERPARPTLPYGSWPSPITATAITEQPGRVTNALSADGDVIWDESRPGEGGRIQLVRRSSDGVVRDVLPEGWGARTRAHEYGGGAWVPVPGGVVFARWEDQRLYRLPVDGRGPARGVAEPLTPEPTVTHGLRYADPRPTPDGRWIVCVRESHEPDIVAAHAEPVNDVVAVPIDGSATADRSAVRVLATGADFYHSPRLSPDGATLAWVQWNHPNMPWDGAELRRTPFDLDRSAGPTVEPVAGELVSGGPAEFTQAPEFGRDGSLWFLSERDGWSALYRLAGSATSSSVERVGPTDAELGGPPWVFGCRWFTLLPDGRAVVVAVRDGFGGLVLVDPARPAAPAVELETAITDPAAQLSVTRDGAILVVGGTADAGAAPYAFRLDGDRVAGWTALAPASEPLVEPAWIAPAEPLAFPMANGATAHALLYRPTNPTVTASPETKPPLLVMIHGGPTSGARPVLNLGIQFWTSRGFMVADVNYRGSTGFGPQYRHLLDGQWGVVDVQDCVAVAEHLVATGEVDPERLAIRGGSAGGYTTLAAHAFHDTFTAGASHYGVADLAALATDTHKFESRYLDGLIGPWPEAREVYEERSPIHHTDGFTQPIAFFQGLEDEVVPPAQSAAMVEALVAKGVPCLHLEFEGEQHGFRQARNIVRALEAELWFYGYVFGFTPADPIEPPLVR